jgi:DNA-binding NarL/FixJ family response regulator
VSGDNGTAARIFMIDDHPAVRAGLRLLLEQQGMVVCGEAADSESTLAGVAATAPDLVLVDLSLGNDSGLTLLRDLANLLPGVALLVYSMHEDAFHVQQAFAAGASGYLTKREMAPLLFEAIHDLLAGRVYASPRAAEILGALPGDPRHAGPLSPRELEVYALLGQGYGATAIALQLGVSRRTVDTFFSRILSKLGIPSMEELRRHAVAARATD